MVMEFEFIAILFVFVVMMLIGTFLNIMFKTTKRIHWLTMFLFCLTFSIIATGIFNSN